MLAQELLEILRCPHCVTGTWRARGEDPGRLRLLREAWLVCEEPACGRKYPIVDGIPDMRPETAERWLPTPLDRLPPRPDWS